VRTALFAVLLAAFFSPPASVRAQDGGDSDRWEARITGASGEVVVHPVGGGDPVEGAVDMPLEEGDRIVTSEGSTAEITLDGQSLITLQENSDFTLENTAKRESVFSLSLGSILAKIQKLGEQGMRIRTPSSVAAVRGTEFGIDVEGSEDSHVGVFDEGRVEVSGQGGGTQVLTPNQETSVARGQAPLRPFALKRFVARRRMMRARIVRLQAIRKAWKSLPPGPRRQRRMAALRRRIKAIRQRKQKVQKRVQQIRKRRAEAAKSEERGERR
jgi:hypothetical protein